MTILATATILTVAGPLLFQSASLPDHDACETKLAELAEFVAIRHRGSLIEAICSSGEAESELFLSASGTPVSWVDFYLPQR